jgi:O-acetyl-ADP-ribose deacetylase (regulator of RNase III)
MINTVIGNLLDAPEQYIAHQCNAMSKGAAGLARALFNRFSYADTYSKRIVPNQPGTIQVLGNGTSERLIINMYAQYYPGNPVPGNWDDKIARERYFKDCLDAIAKLPDLKSIAFPFGIGCGLAGGNWENYSKMLEDFAAIIPDVKVVLYRLEKT